MEKHFCDWCHKEFRFPGHVLRIEVTAPEASSVFYPMPPGEYCDYGCAIGAMELAQKQLKWKMEFENWMNSYHDRVPGKSPFDIFLEEHGRSPYDTHESPPYQLL